MKLKPVSKLVSLWFLLFVLNIADFQLVWSVLKKKSSCWCHAKILMQPIITLKVLNISTPSLEYLLIMTRCSCKTRGISLNAVFLELSPFMTKNFKQIMAFGKRALVPHTVLLLTLNLLEQKMISLCHHYRARSACTSVQSDQALNSWLTNFMLHFDTPKNDNGQFQKWKMDLLLRNSAV